MPTLYVRNVPPAVYRRLKALAETERRSMGAQVLRLLEETLGKADEARESVDQILARIRARRDQIKLPKDWPGTTALLHEGRRGRGGE